MASEDDSTPKTEELAPPKTEELAPIERYALVPTNPTVVALSKAFGWKPETVIARVERALPSKVEQQVYLALAASFHIHPESIAKVLRYHLGPRLLSLTDLERRPIGKNVVSNTFAESMDFIEACMHLIKIVSKEFSAFGMGMELASMIVENYGPNSPEQVVEMIDTNLDECCEYFGVSPHRSYSDRMMNCTYIFVRRVLPELQRRGVPNPLDPDEFIHTKMKWRDEENDEAPESQKEFQKKLRDILSQ